VEAPRRELAKRVTDLTCAPSNLVEMREGVGALAARYGQPLGMSTRCSDGLSQEVAYQVDIPEEERGDAQMARQLPLDRRQPGAQAAIDASSINDETLPRRPLPF